MTTLGPTTGASPAAPARVDLFWIPLGAGGRWVSWNGRMFERAAARAGHRSCLDLYHSALQVSLGPDCFTIEMTPAWGLPQVDRGVTAEGPVGLRGLGRLKAFRYEVHCWRDGTLPDIAAAVGGPRLLSEDPDVARLLLDLVPRFPARTWGRDEQSTGDMWNSNSLTAWLLARAGTDMAQIHPPAGGRAPGWEAGLAVAGRASRTPFAEAAVPVTAGGARH